jgi:hypothetical protein
VVVAWRKSSHRLGQQRYDQDSDHGRPDQQRSEPGTPKQAAHRPERTREHDEKIVSLGRLGPAAQIGLLRPAVAGGDAEYKRWSDDREDPE